MKRRTLILFLPLLLNVQYFHSQTNVTFVNTGQMNVAAAAFSTRVSLYVPDAMRQLSVSGRTVEIIQNGITELGGNFYHDALTTVFAVDGTTKTTSTGKFRFVKEHAGVNRTITTQALNIYTFDRGLHYIAFPHFEISTNDSIAIPGKMGIDASSLHQINSKTGKLILRSDVISSNAYEASLRVPQSGVSANLVDLGSVIVERDMTLYRPTDGSTQLFGFATPFKNTQLSGYYAGNWVRRPLNNGTYGHTNYIYGNKDISPADGTIDEDQYVYLAAEKLVPAQAYLIKPRPKYYDYTQLQSTSGLWYTGEPNASLYDKCEYYFNGKVYTVSPYSEQLFADDVLFSSSINTPNLTSTVNWLIGNSYTCPIPTNLLAQAMQNSTLEFSPYIYVFPAGSTTFQACDISGTGDAIVVANVSEIAAMSVFMVRVARNKAQNGSLSIGKDLLRHADVSHNNPQNVKGINKSKSIVEATNQVTFRVSPLGNDNIFDVTAIGIRETASTGADTYDMSKAFVSDDNIFQLYTLSATLSKLSANGIPPTADSIVLAFNPSKYGGSYNLSSKITQQFAKDGAWIYDTKTQQTIDMNNGSNYLFSALPTDNPERFLVTFKRPTPTALKDISFKLNIYYHNKKVHVKNLNGTDLGGDITLIDMLGKKILSKTINNYPEMMIDVNDILPGIYLIQLKGARTGLTKFIIN
jgi:hypothetical protein